MTKSLDRLTLLETFVRIAERGSISAAARDLGLSQPSASRQLAELERRLGAELVRRTTHDLAVTPAGQDLLHDARVLLEGWEALNERHGHGDTDIRGGLKIVAPIGFGQSALVGILARFQQAHPGIHVDLQLDDADIRFAEIGCDCWLKVGRVPDENLIVRPLARFERLLVAADTLIGDRKIASPADMGDLPCVALAPFDGGSITVNSKRGATRTLRPPVKMVTDNFLAAHRATLMGLGFSVMPRWFIEDDLAAGRLRNLLPSWCADTLTLNVAYLPSRHQPIRLRRFVEALFEEIDGIPGMQPLAAG